MIFLIIAALLVGRCSIDASRLVIPGFKANWYKAQEFCVSLEMALVTVETQAKHDEIAQFVGTTDKFTEGARFWLGASDLAEEGTFVWLSNSRIATFTRWAEGEPSHGENEHCVEIIYNPFVNRVWKWNDQDCRNFSAYFICESTETASNIEQF